jgi:pimeloyl-ACP methyl ester carboxylesterase
MAGDSIALLDHLAIPEANLMGYSMGARISVFAALVHPDRVRSLVLGGLGIGMTDGVGDWDPIADALLAPSLDDVSHARGRMFRAFADQTKSDRRALAACIAVRAIWWREPTWGRSTRRRSSASEPRTISRGPRGTGRVDAECQGARYSRTRPYAGRGRPGIQEGSARILR